MGSFVYKESNVEKSPTPISQRPASAESTAGLSSVERPSRNALLGRKSWSTQRNRPPAAYWVKEYLVSPAWVAVFEWRMVAEGMRIVAPGGNSITSFRSQRTRCPPSFGLKRPRAVMAHHPKGRFPGSVWG